MVILASLSQSIFLSLTYFHVKSITLQKLCHVLVAFDTLNVLCSIDGVMVHGHYCIDTPVNYNAIVITLLLRIYICI